MKKTITLAIILIMTFIVNAQLLNNSGISPVKNNPDHTTLNKVDIGKQKNFTSELQRATTHVNTSSENTNLLTTFVSKIKTAETKVNTASKPLLDSIVTKKVSGINSKKEIFYYDKNGNDTTVLSYDWDIATAKWLISLREKSVKDNNGLILSYETYIWIGGFYYIGGTKYENTYNTNNKVVTKTEYTWNVLTSNWIYSSKSENSYDAQNNLITTIGYSRDNNLNVWNQLTKSVYSYDVNNKLISETDYNWDSIAVNWVNNIRDDHSYDTHGNDTLTLGYKWDNVGLVWNVNNKTRSLFDSNNLPTGFELWNWNSTNNTWTGAGKLAYVYNINRQPTSFITYLWYSNNSTWLAYTKVESIYDGNNNKTIENSYNWNTGTSLWDKVEISTYYYTFVSTSSPTLSATNPVIYPNPVSTELQISGLSENSNISILDITGKTIFTQNNIGKTIDVSALNEGIYFLQIANMTGRVNYKFIKIRSK